MMTAFEIIVSLVVLAMGALNWLLGHELSKLATEMRKITEWMAK